MWDTEREYDFNPRAYVRHDTQRVDLGFNGSNFNPRAYVRHDASPGLLASSRRDFNPRAYVRHDDLRSLHR